MVPSHYAQYYLLKVIHRWPKQVWLQLYLEFHAVIPVFAKVSISCLTAVSFAAFNLDQGIYAEVLTNCFLHRGHVQPIKF
ncbi:Uncharacterised protein [Acinetobacter baumannii]|nr:Uncharacterised protein [Acinetobacter baumannii]